jgi:WD40 repeat protein
VSFGGFCGLTSSSQAEDLPQFVSQLVLPAPTDQEQVDANRDRAVAVALGPTGQFLAVGLESGHLAVWNLTTKRIQFTQQAHEQPVKLLALGAEDRQMLTSADDLQVRLWDLDEGQAVVDYEGAPMRAMYDGFAFEPRERFFASYARRQPGVTILRLAEGAEPATFLEDALVQCLAIDPTGNLLACGCSQGDTPIVRLIQSADGQEMGTVTLPEARDGNGLPGPTSLAFSGNGEVLAIALSDARILRVNVSSQQVTETHSLAGAASLVGLAWIGTREALLCASSYDADGNVTSVCWKAGSPNPIWKADGVVSCDVRRMLSAWVSRNGDVVLADAKSGAKLWQLRPFGMGMFWK